MNISDATLRMLIGTYFGQNSLHARDVHAALVELKERRAALKDALNAMGLIESMIAPSTLNDARAVARAALDRAAN